MADLAHEYRSLLSFLYRAPIALVQSNIGGDIEMMSPVAARLLLPLARRNQLDNIFDALAEVAPDLRQLCSAFPHSSGSICEGLRVDVPADGTGRPRQVLSLNIVKLSSARLVTMLADITAQALQSQQDAQDRLATQRQLAELSSDLEHALAVVAVSIAREDLVTGRVLSTERLRHALGLQEPTEDLTIARWLQQVHPEDRAMFNEDRERAALGQQTSFRDFRFVRPDGSIGYMAGRRYLERDGAGKPVSLVTFGIDVTDQRSAELERLALAEHLSLATTAAGVGTFEVEAKTGAVAWNAQTYALYGRPHCAGQDTRQVAREALSASELDRVAAWKRGMLQGRLAESIEFEVTWPDGSIHWLAGRGRLRWDDAGQVMSLIGVIWDVTERRRSEQAVRGQQVAEEASRAKTQFLSRMSHELRTPLNAILGFSELLLIDRQGTISPTQALQLTHIQNAGRHLLKLITDLLDVSRIELGALNVRCTKVCLDEVVREAVQAIGPLATGRHVEIGLAMAAERGTVLADPTRLMQVLLNLLSNAVKYNREGGRVTVQTRRADDGWRVDVIDTGIGMTDVQLHSLFQPFNRLGRDDSGIQGVGIGLVLTKQLTEAMGGSLTAASAPEVGSTFSVHLRAFDGT